MGEQQHSYHCTCCYLFSELHPSFFSSFSLPTFTYSMSGNASHDQIVPDGEAHPKQEQQQQQQQDSTNSTADSQNEQNDTIMADIPQQSSSVQIGDSLNGIQYPEFLRTIGDSNQIHTPWADIQQAIKAAILQQCEIMEPQASERERSIIEGIKTNILHGLERHERPPFTIQRLCELIIDPKRHYRMYIKYMNAIEKVLTVTSAWNDFIEHTETNGSSNSASHLAEVGGLLGVGDIGVEQEPITIEANGHQEERIDSMDVDS
ncbi:hypothetical protein LRAMOSA06315 [Lichtheimia ramosa]|uniref:Uncharacterized protein n=1 Tax=Lichtheimia ramosa TaxID=688394 RepID=A0A077X3I9_9FUNG|nr:hypothetical protein LRAMOSA06315 [Lichtheimia ramosa]